MSTTVMSACWPLQMPPTPKAVLMSLADNANDHGECWPSIPTIAIRTCFTERSVQRAIGWLESEGLLIADRSNGRHTRYTVTPPTLLPMVKNPRQRVTPVTKSPVTDSREPPSESREPPSQSPSNRKEPSRTVSKEITRELNFSDWPSEPSPQVLADWLAHRKAKKAPLSQTVVDSFARELARAQAIGWTVDECLAEQMNRNWQGFKAAWLDDARTGTLAPNVKPMPMSKTAQGMASLENLKNETRQRMAVGGDCDGFAEARLSLVGPHSGR